MQKFTNCPVGSFNNISFQYIAGTARKLKEPPKWLVDRCEYCSLVLLNPRRIWDELIDYYPSGWQCYNTYVSDEEEVVK